MTIASAWLVTHPANERAAAARAEMEGELAAAGVAIDERKPDLVVALGGDGTMLRAAKVAHACDALLLGVNLGALGYLTEVEASHAQEALRSVLAGDHTIETRMMVQATVGETSFSGLNEVLIERTGTHRLVRLEATVGGERLAGFSADGLLIATPSGSTAYALSAGGPIVSPRAECLVLVPVAAHMIFARPFVLAADEVVEVRLGDDSQRAEVVLDGVAAAEIGPATEVVVARHPRPLRLAKLQGPGFIERLRVKLGLPG